MHGKNKPIKFPSLGYGLELAEDDKKKKKESFKFAPTSSIVGAGTRRRKSRMQGSVMTSLVLECSGDVIGSIVIWGYILKTEQANGIKFN